MGIARCLPRAACLLLVAATGLAGCGGGDGNDSSGDSTAASSTGTKSVSIEDFIYQPAGITVPRGATVEFTNRDSSPHTATSTEAGIFESGTIKEDETGSITLDKPGSFDYYCAFHPFMKGKIVVE